MFELHTLPLGKIDTNSYLLLTADCALLIDAAPGCALAIEPLLEGRKLHALLLTHGHWDHVWDVAAVKQRYQVECYAHPGDAELIRAQQLLFNLKEPLPPFSVEHDLQHGQQLQWGSLCCQVLYTPGHSPGGVVYLFSAEKLLFSGDTLFYRSVGASHFPGGNLQQLQQSIRTQLYQLDPNLMVYPGHGQPTSIGEERRLNPYVAATPAS